MSLRGLRAKAATTGFFCVALALVWLPCGTVRAEAELELVWRSPEGCPDAIWAMQRIRAQLGRDLSSTASAKLNASVVITPVQDKYRLTLSTRRGATSGERAIEDARCTDLAEAATLMIALTVDADAVLDAQAQSDVSTQASGQTSTPGAAQKTPSDSELPPSLQPKPRARAAKPERDLRIRASVMGDAGFLPAPSLGPELTISIARAGFALEGGGFWLPQRRSQGAQSVVVGMWAFALRGCRQRASNRWIIGGCLGAELGSVTADGRGLQENLQKRAWFSALDGLVRVRLRMTQRMWLATDLGVSVPFLRPRFVTQDTRDKSQTSLHTPHVLTARASLGVEFSF